MYNLIEITNLSKSFKGFKAVDNLTLHIPSNQYLALLGPNGAGKTTLVEMTEGLREPDTGTITINGKNWRQHADYLRTIMGISLQETKFMDKVTVRETLDLFGSFFGCSRQRTNEVMEMVNLTEKQKSFVVNLSGGQRQRLALGVALLNEPQLLLLDEPTTGLDPNARREIWDILMHLKKQQRTTLILTTHYMEEAAYLCDRIVILDRGKVLADGKLDELLSSYASGEIISCQIGRPLAENLFQQLNGIQQVMWQEKGTKAELTVDSITRTLPELLTLLEQNCVEVLALECRKKTLDDLFVAMTGRKLHE